MSPAGRVIALSLSLLAAGCGTFARSQGASRELAAARGTASPERKVTRDAEVVVVVDDPNTAASEVSRLVEQAGGFMEHSTASEDSKVWLGCRVPAARLDEILASIAALGTEQSRTIRANDVTDQYSDLETRLRNDRALRDRLQQLLARAKDVKDVLAIETELNRIQSQIETEQAQFERLKGQVELSGLDVTLERRHILGPLGYASYGLWWVISKLFVIR